MGNGPNEAAERQACYDALTPEEREIAAEYVAMAADREQEREALEWCEALIGDLDLGEWQGSQFEEQGKADSSLRSE